jgi:2-polyprenyl-6-hydroxyphenyl methylase/3-demethylubiquinone-9 3-methyltransferase
MMATQTLNAQQRLDDFRPEVLADRHERQLTLLRTTGVLGQPPYRVLDLGGGSGVTAVWAARKGWPVTVLDIDKANLEVLRRHVAREEPDLSIEVIVGDVTGDPPVPESAFDIVYLKDLVEHVEDYASCLTLARRSLKPGGLVYVATTNVLCPIQLEYHGVGPYSWYPRWLKERIRHYAMTRRPQIVAYTMYPALHWFSRRSLGRALRDAGFNRVWDIFDLIRTSQDLTRRTRLIYPLIRAASFVPMGRDMIDVLMPGLTMVAQRPVETTPSVRSTA